jgi:hypothetical protein
MAITLLTDEPTDVGWPGTAATTAPVLSSTRAHFEIVLCVEHFRAAGARPDLRLADAIDAIRRAQRGDGTWHLQRGHRGRTWLRVEEPGPSRWATLRGARAPLVGPANRRLAIGTFGTTGSGQFASS